MQRILVPVDFSPLSERAAAVAAGIAKKTGGRVFLLHVSEVHTRTYGDGTQREEDDIPANMAEIKRVKDAFVELEKQPFFEGVNLVTAVQFDGGFEEVTDNAEKNNIDLIVTGTHGVKGMKEVFLGSFSGKLVNLAACPVLSLKKTDGIFEPKKAVFVSSFFGETVDPFRDLQPLIELFDPEQVSLLHVVTESAFDTTLRIRRRMEDFARDVGLQDYKPYIITAADIEQGVKDFLTLYPHDLLAIETHGRRGISGLFRPNLAEKLVNHLEVPVLSTRIHPNDIEYGVLFPG